jgi:tRNA A37 threonylcarbamoyladenosine modification protein TsaB
MKLEVDIVVIAINSPLIIGIYQDKKLVEKISVEGKTSQLLPVQFKKIIKQYTIKNVLFANGPGSFMAIKITYIFLKSLSTVLDFQLFSQDAFFFNKNKPIKAINGNFFIKNNNKIEMVKLNQNHSMEFFLPEVFEQEKYSKDIEPLYILPFL